MEKTFMVQIGNTDNKLSQTDWAMFVEEINGILREFRAVVHFFGGPPTYAPYQNTCWVFSVPSTEPYSLADMKTAITTIRAQYDQDSAAWTEGTTEFI
jgi:hypothetical protein